MNLSDSTMFHPNVPPVFTNKIRSGESKSRAAELQLAVSAATFSCHAKQLDLSVRNLEDQVEGLLLVEVKRNGLAHLQSHHLI